MDYVKASIQSAEMRERGDCTVKAVAIVTNSAYKVAHKAMKVLGKRKDRDGASILGTNNAIKGLGFALERLEVPAKTVATLAREDAVQEGLYIAYTRTHVLAIKDGYIEDWTRGRRHRIVLLYKVTPAVSRKERKQLAKAVFN